MKNIQCIAAITFIMILAGCAPASPESELNEKSANAKQLVEDLVYVKDDKSGLCFAYAWNGGGYGGPAFTQVPCEKVEKLLINKAN